MQSEINKQEHASPIQSFLYRKARYIPEAKKAIATYILSEKRCHNIDY